MGHPVVPTWSRQCAQLAVPIILVRIGTESLAGLIQASGKWRVHAPDKLQVIKLIIVHECPVLVK